LESDDRQAGGYQGAIDEANHQLASKESDEIPVYLGKDRDNLIFELRVPDRQELTPGRGYSRTLFEEEKKINRYDKKAEEITENAEHSSQAGLDEGPCLLSKCGQLIPQILERLLDVGVVSITVKRTACNRALRWVRRRNGTGRSARGGVGVRWMGS
jgi:hypothetical protein